MRSLSVLLVGVALLMPLGLSSATYAAESDAQRAAQEIAAARARANAAADALFAAESRLDQLQVDQAALQQQTAELQSKVSTLQRAVEQVAVNRFTRSGETAIPLFTEFSAVIDQAQVDVLIGIVDETSADDLDTFAYLQGQLRDKQNELANNAIEAEAAKRALDQRRTEALAEVERLKQVEAVRLKDEAVRQALAALEAERIRQEQAQAQADAAAGAAAAGLVGAVDQTGSLGQGDSVDTGGGASGGSSGGQTGGGGTGSRPGGSVGDVGGPNWLCPVQGPTGFGDTWGAPRSGGRRHEGVDMIGERGLPLVAVVDGFAQQKTNELGGNTVSLSGADGSRYYYAHLDTFEASGAVTAGTVIGYLGDTGNAKFSVPHLHFEIHPGAGAAVNPYPTVRAHC